MEGLPRWLLNPTWNTTLEDQECFSLARQNQQRQHYCRLGGRSQFLVKIITVARYELLYCDQIAEAFCSYRFAEAYPYMADEIKWNIVGREELTDREAAKFLETVSPTITKLNINRAETNVATLSRTDLITERILN